MKLLKELRVIILVVGYFVIVNILLAGLTTIFDDKKLILSIVVVFCGIYSGYTLIKNIVEEDVNIFK